jgi:GNAT superfamily N-acetyltransferase
MTSPVIEEFTLPESLDGPGADDFRVLVDLRNTIARESLGPAADDSPPEELLPYLLDQEHNRNRILLARVDGEIAGVAAMFWAVDTDSNVLWGEINVPAQWRGRGIGTRLLGEIEAFTRDLGRTILQGGAFHKSVDGPRLDSPTGFGSLPREEQSVRFLLDHGF